MIELPDFVSRESTERAYHRAKVLQNAWAKYKDGRSKRARAVGCRMARLRNAKMLLFLEKGAEHLRAMNDEQASRVVQEGYAKSDFAEFSQWREAFLLTRDPKLHEDVDFVVFGWIYAAVAEALGEV